MGCVMDVRCEMDPSTTNNKTNTYCLNIDLTQASLNNQLKHVLSEHRSKTRNTV
jgi:hypothetical protein